MRNLILIGVLAMLFGFSAVVVAQDETPARVKCYMKFNLRIHEGGDLPGPDRHRQGNEYRYRLR